MLGLVAFFGRMLLPIVAIIAGWAEWVGPKTAVSFVLAGYIISQYTVMVARCALCRIEGTEQPSWFWAISISAICAILCMALWMA